MGSKVSLNIGLLTRAALKARGSSCPPSHLFPLPCPCRLFGFVARKQGSTTDNACHLFAELDPSQPASAIVNFVSKVMLSAGQKR